MDFEAAEATIRDRLDKLNKKADALHEKKQTAASDSDKTCELSRTEISKVRNVSFTPIYALFDKEFGAGE